jgi:hypothetical protein
LERINSIRNQVATYQSENIYLESTYCHSSCFSGDTILKLLLDDKEIKLTFKELEESLDNIEIDRYKVLTPEGYQHISQLFINGEKDVFLINNKIKCTIDHKFVIDLNTNQKIEIGYLLNKEVETTNGKEIITSISYIGKEDVYDLEVYHSNHRYIINDLYIVSNCHSSCFSGDTNLDILYKDIKYQISFQELSINLLNGYNLEDYKIFTPEGYKSILNFYRNGIKKIYLINDKIKCTIDHKFVTDLQTNKMVQIKNLLGKEVSTLNGLELIKSIIEIDENLVYDLEVDSTEHRYVINSQYIVSNCHSCIFPDISFIDIKIDHTVSNVSLLELESLYLKNKNISVLTPDGYSLVTNYFTHGKKLVYKAIFEDLEIMCTLDHKLFITNTEFKTLNDINIGDTVYTKSGYKKLISKTEVGLLDTVDLEVENKYHNFYCNNILVSNSRGRR